MKDDITRTHSDFFYIKKSLSNGVGIFPSSFRTHSLKHISFFLQKGMLGVQSTQAQKTEDNFIVRFNVISGRL